MKCKDCGGEVDAETQQETEEANEILLMLGREANLKPKCNSCLALMFGEAVIN
jgi:hypothetical protein